MVRCLKRANDYFSEKAALERNRVHVRFLSYRVSIRPVNRRRKATRLRIVKMNVGDLGFVESLRDH